MTQIVSPENKPKSCEQEHVLLFEKHKNIFDYHSSHDESETLSLFQSFF